MPTFCDLPTELRQRILALAMPELNYIRKPWPRSMFNLMHVNQQLRSDMGFVIDSWSPIHYVSHSQEILQIQDLSIKLCGRRRSPKFERIRLDIFHSADASVMRDTCYYRYHDYFGEADYWQKWNNAIAKLPLSASEVSIDITPAPAELRNRHDLELNSFVHDRRVKHFLESLSAEVADLIRLLNEHYPGRHSMRATGKLSVKCTFFISALERESGVPIEFDGIWVSGEDSRFADINLAARQVARTGVGRKAERKGAKNPLAWLRDVQWSRQTSWTFAKVAQHGEEEAAVQELRVLADFAKEGGKELLEMDPVGGVRRALQHRMAEDLGLKTSSEGDDPERRVVVTK
ncbi:uncharacterized protein CC84DRAFT_1211045 [Paraphaeosphaeria sporulosa]|uniref:R3H domain-containing protein n=1 Tax=Paraphaeosphaeria sporulosa TaxID=1460663 RepID=A0A177CV04_9PLEO|nr:uncharacterized protein CC84DRAFT_1211045 [Paraphaeosphaeria sporulosa]OAG11384.1 hypothetical protein CC84DRAFT_1211045 [Paraphaeosphaeria sporulosa]